MNEAHEKSTADRQSASTNDLEKASLDTVYATLATSPKGLASSEAKQRLEKYGRNELVEKENLARDYNIYVFHGTDGEDWDGEGKEALPEIERLHSAGDTDGAMRLLNVPPDDYAVMVADASGTEGAAR